jgi:protein-tyrosine phosphatase
MKTWRLGLASLSVALVALAGGAAPFVAAPAIAASAHRAAQIPFTSADVQSPDGRAFTVTWAAGPAAGAVEVYARNTPSANGPQGLGRRVGRGGSSGQIAVADLPNLGSGGAARWYFELKPAHGAPLVTADRSLHLKTAPNFRDIGGYRTVDGRWVRMGLVYRSDELDRLSDADLARVGELAPLLVVDFRTLKERTRGPDRLPPGAVGLVEDVLADAPPSYAKITDAAGAADFLADANRQFVSLPSARASYSGLFSRLPTASEAVVYHCSAGKDRTGWATAVLLTALGVPRATVMADYLASNAYLADKNRAMFAALPPAAAARMAPIMTVRAAYLQAGFDEVDRRYGSFDNYLQKGLGMDDKALAQLKARFLAGAPVN